MTVCNCKECRAYHNGTPFRDDLPQEVPVRKDTSTQKDTNPKDAVGVRKVPLMSVIPSRVLAGIALALLEGARKYRRHNYRVAGVRASVYVDAARRHQDAWWEGQDLDPDSDLSHIDKAIASLVVLRDSMYQGNWDDDRPPAVDPGWLEDANRKAGQIIDRVRPDDPLPPYTQKGCAEASVPSAQPVLQEPMQGVPIPQELPDPGQRCKIWVRGARRGVNYPDYWLFAEFSYVDSDGDLLFYAPTLVADHGKPYWYGQDAPRTAKVIKWEIVK